MTGPVHSATTAIIQGGPLDGLVWEIDAGQTKMEIGSPLITWGNDEGALERAAGTYRYGGRIDDDGNAIFVQTGGQ